MPTSPTRRVLATPSATPTTLLLRTTLRVHDNPALDAALQSGGLRRVVVPVLTASVPRPSAVVPTVTAVGVAAPRFEAWTQGAQHQWGYHQYVFLLHAIHSHVRELRARLPTGVSVHVWRGTPTALARAVRGSGRAGVSHTCVCDVADDVPMWGELDRALDRVYHRTPEQLRRVVTHTLLDWSASEHAAFLGRWAPGLHNKTFHRYVADQSSSWPSTTQLLRTRLAIPRRKTRRASAPSPKAPTPPLEWDLAGELRTWTSVLQRRGATPFGPPSSLSCEAWALAQLDACATTLASTQWEKPKSAPVLRLREHATEPMRDTSKLSPFLAVGVLSPRLVYSRWRGKTPAAVKANAARPSSGVAQLLWREEFHAAARLPGFWDTRATATPKTPHPPRLWRRDMDWAVTRGDDPALKPFLHATTGEADLDVALVVLARDGWVHHLRRHIIADYFTRGQLQADWMLGESWFRQTLVDHDACVNRGNWLWLSACEFSTKQMFMHYKWSTYVTRESRGVTVRPSP